MPVRVLTPRSSTSTLPVMVISFTRLVVGIIKTMALNPLGFIRTLVEAAFDLMDSFDLL
jgi:hypothetical protein